MVLSTDNDKFIPRPARDDGGPAFAFSWTEMDGPVGPGPQTAAHPGMSLRDYFAGQALHGLCASMIDQENWEEIDRHKVAWYAYGFADAMLRERNKK